MSPGQRALDDLVDAYRSSAKCRLSWCVKEPGHDGWHEGEPVPYASGAHGVRVAPPNETEGPALIVTEIRLTPEQRKRLSLGEPLRIEERPTQVRVEGARPWMGALYDFGRWLKRAVLTGGGGDRG